MGEEARAGAAGKASEPEQALGYRFRCPRLLEEALTHASLVRGRVRRSNERLEFLGDRVLGLVIARLLFEHYPEDPEGALGRRLSHLVSREVLAEVARGLGLGRWVRLSRGEEESGGRDNPGILADCLEAVIGAIFLDGGLEAAEGFVRHHWEERVRALARPPRDPKTELQEWAQGRGLPRPEYRLVAVEGPAHAPRFRIEVELAGFAPATGEGPNKRAAEQAAARKLLERVLSPS